MSLEPPVLDPTKNAAAAIREVTDAQHLRGLGRIDRTGAISPGLAESWNDLARTARSTSSSCARA